MKLLLYVLGGLGLLVVGFFALNAYIYEEKQAPASSDYKTAAYSINGAPVTLGEDVQYFGNEVRTDLDSDGDEDVAFLITSDFGGSGTFYYVVAALMTERGYVGSAAHFLGDRIAPQTTEVSSNPSHKGVIVVNYADRAEGEPMSSVPSVGVSVWLKLDVQSMQFGEVVQNFEGEADPSKMNLRMKDWEWVSALYNDGTKITPRKEGDFVLTFEDAERFSVNTDCNSMAGNYTTNEGVLAFSEIMMTEMYCEGSKEGDFAKLLENTASYLFTSKGELVLELKFDSGTATFR